jgi:hypothetical protein
MLKKLMKEREKKHDKASHGQRKLRVRKKIKKLIKLRK